MLIVENYSVAVVCCLVTMLCWGSWANTQKLSAGKWPYEYFYWGYVWGILLFSLAAAFTAGSFGDQGRSFVADISQASGANIISAFVGGIIFNLANILLTSAIVIAGMSVAFPIGIGIALILGVLVNYWGVQKGDPVILFTGVAFVMLAIVLNSMAYTKAKLGSSKLTSKGIFLSIAAGVLMSFFYRFVAASMDLSNFIDPAPLKMTPYSAFVVFAFGILGSNVLFNTIMMKRPMEGSPLSYKGYFSGKISLHLVGLLGGIIWGIGNLLNLLAAGKAGPAVSYGLGQGATLVAAIWGVLIWKEFRNAKQKVGGLLMGMFACFIVGLLLIIYSGA